MYSQLKGLTGAEIIYKKLIEYGTKTVSLHSGGAIMPLVDQFHKSKNKKIIMYILMNRIVDMFQLVMLKYLNKWEYQLLQVVD